MEEIIERLDSLEARVSALEMRTVPSANTKAVLNEMNEILGNNEIKRRENEWLNLGNTSSTKAVREPIKVHKKIHAWHNAVNKTLANMRKSDPTATRRNAMGRAAAQLDAMPEKKISTKNLISTVYINTPNGYRLRPVLRSRRGEQHYPDVIPDQKRFENMVRAVRKERPRNKNFIKTAVSRLIAENKARRNKTKRKVVVENNDDTLEEFYKNGKQYYKSHNNILYAYNGNGDVKYIGKYNPVTSAINTSYPNPNPNAIFLLNRK